MKRPEAPSVGGQGILDVLATPVFAVNRNYRYTAFNPAHAAVMRYAYGAEVELGGNVLEYHTIPLDGELLRTSFDRALTGETMSSKAWVGREGARRFYWTTHSPVRDGDEIVGIAVVALDLTEHEMGEQGRARLAAIIESSDDAVMSISLDGVIMSWNPGAERIYGYSAQEAIGRDLSMIALPEERGRMQEILDRIGHGERVERYETVRFRKDGGRVDVSLGVSPLRSPEGAVVGASSIGHDMTERKQAEETLRTERQRLHDVLEVMPVMVCLLTPDHRVAFANRAFREEYGESHGRYCYEYCFGGTEPCDFCETYKVLETGMPHHWEVAHPAGGTTIDSYDFPFTDADGSPMILEVALDITERKRAEQDQTRLVAIVESSDDAIISTSLDGVILSWNPGAERIYGYSAQEAIGQGMSVFIPPEEREDLPEVMRRVLGGERVERFEIVGTRKDGGRVDVSLGLSPLRSPEGAVIGVSSIGHDVTARKRAERDQTRLATIVESSDDAIFSVSLDGVTLTWNPGAEKMFGYPAEEVIGQPARMLTPSEEPEHMQDILDRIGRGERPERYETVRMHKDGGPVDVSVGVSPLTDHDGVVIGVAILARDITERKRAEEALAESLREVERAMRGTVSAMGRICESRDPYTAGHEARVARLAVAIAREMGLSDEDVDAIDVAAAIHDVGKIGTPAEILSKPGKLSVAEIVLVHGHAKAGYEIVREIDFPWPIADMILQHHERMDGSGYPDGLLGDDIVLGARIIAAADVVEAMSSHRPYRPAPGVEVAIAFVREGRGLLFDAQVVDACLEVLSRDPGVLEAAVC